VSTLAITEALDPVASAVAEGLSRSRKVLPPWLFYDRRGSELFERITRLPEYTLTRTERMLLETHVEEILLSLRSPVTVVELGAGTATKTGVLLRAATRMQDGVLYQPIDVSPTALDEARATIESQISGVTVLPQIANYVTDFIHVEREVDRTVLAMYIGSSIGNFSPLEARGILRNLRARMQAGDALLLGTDLAPGPGKSVEALVAAYDDSAGVTAAFNRNILHRLNRELGADFVPGCFDHEARWNEAECRIEMHLVSKRDQVAHIPANSAERARTVHFRARESIHTENSYKFTSLLLEALLVDCGFNIGTRFEDSAGQFAVTLARAV
jgi:L-histidine N-alpha-methyltransferase